VKDDATHELDVEGPHVNGPPGALAGHGEGGHQQVVGGGARFELGLEFGVLARSSASERALICGSISLMAATTGSNFLTSRSCWLPKTLVRIVLIIEVSLGMPGGQSAGAVRRRGKRLQPGV